MCLRPAPRAAIEKTLRHLTSYLLAQGRRRPLQSFRFCAAEALRRARSLRPVATNGLAASSGDPGEQFRPFAPANVELAAGAAVLDSALLAQADRVCRGELPIFGEDVRFGLAPDWHADWRTGHRWPLEESVAVLAGPPGTDVKRPWEVARFHHGLRLAQAYRLTREPRYAEAFSQQVLHWLRNNPYPRGIHWAMPMEVALRAVNWATAAAGLADAPLTRHFGNRSWLPCTCMAATSSRTVSGIR